jgi:hypothetical protein
MSVERCGDSVECYAAIGVGRQWRYDGARAATLPNVTRDTERLEV